MALRFNFQLALIITLLPHYLDHLSLSQATATIICLVAWAWRQGEGEVWKELQDRRQEAGGGREVM